MKYITLLFSLILLAGCPRDPASTETPPNNPEFRIDKLFTTADGCTAYRFWDGRRVYFVRCGGSTDTTWSESCGKNCTEDHNVREEDR